MNISKCICVEGSSTISFDDAIKYALFEVSKSVDYIYDINTFYQRKSILW